MGYSFCAYSFFSGIIICSMTAFGTTDGGSITWYDPPAVETVKDPAIISSVNKSLIKGSISEELNCDFSLSKDLRLITVSMKFGITPVATYLRSQQALSVAQRFRSRFNATWVPNRLTLILLNATFTDEGEYICEVVTFGRSVYTWVRKIQVSLLVPPSISEITGKTVIEGGNVTLKCLAEGKPTPSITWTRLSDNSVVTMPLINISRHDVREYRSTADNGVGTPATRDVTIDVQFPPTIAEISGSQTVIEGENVTLKCLADGKPTPKITWTRLSDNSVVSMILTYISRQDAGKYRCTADNRMGSPATGDVLIIVQYPVEAKGFGENATVLEGSAKNFSCPVDGNPKPKITWYKGSEVSGKSICHEEKLEARESGCYTCAASNFLGQSVIITQCL